MSADPPRLLADEAASHELAQAVRWAKERRPSADRLAGIAKRLGIAPPIPPTTPPAAHAAKASISSGMLATGGAITTVITLAGVGVFWIASKPTPAPHPTRTSAPITAPHAEPAPEIAPREEAVIEPAPIIEAEPARVVRRVRPHVEPAPIEVPPAPAPSSMREEAELIHRASRALSSDPLDALRLADEHRRRFAETGTLHEEREVIAIDALLRLGRRTAAEGRARSFELMHPGSIHNRRIHRLLDR